MTTADGAVLGTTQIFGQAPRRRGFNIVLMAEGYTAAQQAAFDTAAGGFVAAFLATPPFDELRSVVNVFRVNVASTGTGAADPVAAGGTGAAPHTYFDASFGAYGLRRALICNTTLALQVAAAQVPEFTVPIVVVNSSVYGGTGGVVATYSMASGPEVAIHEIGHSAFGLADEYPYYAGGAEPDYDRHPGYEPAEPNITTKTNRTTLKWAWAVAPATPLPSMRNPSCSAPDPRPSTQPPGTVGLFEGAGYYHCGAYRPEYDCKMHHLGAPFCRVCRQAIWNRMAPLSYLEARPRAPITVLARYPEHLDLFTQAADGRIMSNWWDTATGWAGWYQVSGGMASGGGNGSPITAVSRKASHLDLFTVGINDRAYWCSWDVASGWAAWVPVGTLTCRPGSTITAVSRYDDHLDVFTTASDGRTMTISWDAATGWGPDWYHIGGGVAAAGTAVTAVARRRHRLDLFTVGPDAAVYTCGWDERAGWTPWSPLPGVACSPTSVVTVVSRHPDQLDLFTTAADGSVMSAWWNVRTGWGSWFRVAGGSASAGSAITAIARFSNHLDVFVVGTGNRVLTTFWHDPGGWAPWSNPAGGIGQPGGPVAAISRSNEHMDAFTVGGDGLVWGLSWDAATGWNPWEPVGVT